MQVQTMAGRKDETKIYDRMSADLPTNSQVVPAVVRDAAGDYIKVLRSVRDDPLAGMLSRSQIDAAQYEAGRLWQQYREDSEIGGAQAIDTTKEAVDGGRFKEPDITRMSKALRELKLADEELGAYDASLIYDVLARRMSITQIAAARSITSGRQISYTMERFRGALEKLARLWGLVTK